MLYQRVIGEAEEGLGRLSELEGTLVELGDGLVYVQDGVLLVHLTDHLQGQNTLPPGDLTIATWRSGDQHSSDLGLTLR